MFQRRLITALGYMCAILTLAAVFSMYFGPDVILYVVGRIWSCF